MRLVISIASGLGLVLLVMITTQPHMPPFLIPIVLLIVFWAGTGHAWNLNRPQDSK